MQLSNNLKNVLKTVSEEYEVKVRSYSGRFGANDCLGFVVYSFQTFTRNVLDVICEFDFDDEEEAESDLRELISEFSDMLAKTSSDNMGLDTIIYIPSIKWTKELQEFFSTKD